jgi:hypothetical protein
MGTDTAPAALAGERWKARPSLAWIVRAVTLLLPFVLSMAAGIWLSRVLPTPDGLAETAAWYLAIILGTVAVLFGVERAVRRLLPLGLLLRLSLVFPDRAPSRVRVAHRAGSARRLVDQLHAADAEQEPATIVTLAAALNAHDRRTRGHSERVRALSELVSEELGLPPDDRERLRWAAFLHDVGKLAVPSKVLNKTSPLDAREWKIVRTHPEAGEEYARALAPWMGEWLHTIGDHHERYDGAGYPQGLAGREISLGGRIVAVTDAFETMTALRSYNRPITPQAARSEVVRCAGTQFDPRVARALITVSVSRLRWQVGLAAWMAQLPFLGIPARVGARVVTSAASVEASSGSLFGAMALSIAGVATPLAAVGSMSSAERHPDPAPVTTPAGATAEAVVETGPLAHASIAADDPVEDEIRTTDTATVDDETGRPAEVPGNGGPGAGNGAGQGNGGPGAGNGPGNVAGQGGGVANGGVGQANGNGNAKRG